MPHRVAAHLPEINQELQLIGARLSRLRRDRNLSLVQAADLSQQKQLNAGHGFSTAAIGSWERGTRTLSVSVLLGMALLYDVSPVYLLTGNLASQDLADFLDRQAKTLRRTAKKATAAAAQLRAQQ